MGGAIRRIITGIGIDKWTHFFASAFLVFAVSHFWPFWAGIAVAVVLGIAKELYDAKTGGKFEIKDLLADLLGVAIATFIVLL